MLNIEKRQIMKYYKGDMDKDMFLRYVESHSKTQRALFHKNMVAEICELNGEHETAKEIMSGIKEWYSVDLSNYVKEIRDREGVINN
jgi:hypothetical protein